MSYNSLQVFNYTIRKWEVLKVCAVFKCAVVPEELAQGPYYGINIGISVFCDDKKKSCQYIGSKVSYLLGENGMKVPVELIGGNYRDEQYSTDCFFGYITPDLVAPDKPPVSALATV